MASLTDILKLPEGATVVDDHFVRFPGIEAARALYQLELIPAATRFTCCHRYEPFWMIPESVTDLSKLPKETQYLLGLLESGEYVLLIPAVDGVVRCALEGGDTGLSLVAETGDSHVSIPDFDGIYVALGDNPYHLLEESAKRFANHFPAIRLRTEKSVPEFINWFGWCTWDAFYSEVSEQKVRTGLASFQKIGIHPKYLILDDGWLSTQKDEEAKANRLSSFDANEKFQGGLGSTVNMAKQEFGISTVLAWHAMTGYWGGVDPAFPGCEATIFPRISSPGISSYVGEMSWWGTSIGLISPKEIYRFFQEFHRNLRAQGIDGVKVDVQAQLEIVSEGQGGRTGLMRAYHEALEGSVAVHFQGNLINCMSCANEMLYGAPASNLTRTSTDFWPDKPESHGLHLYTNAQVSSWFGEFIHPDWDMFQSGHPAGAYHAAGRAVSGGPVYVSDKPDAHNVEVLNRLVLPDGTILRTLKPGRPTEDCLLHDPTKEDILFKIFSTNPVGGIIGAFNARYGGPEEPITVSGSIRPNDVDGIFGPSGKGEVAVYGFQHQKVKKLTQDQSWDIFCGELGWEVFTVVPIQYGFAPIGSRTHLNSGGAIRSWNPGDDSHWVVSNISGEFLAYSERTPQSVTVNGQGVRAEYYPDDQIVLVDIPASALPYPVIQYIY